MNSQSTFPVFNLFLGQLIMAILLKGFTLNHTTLQNFIRILEAFIQILLNVNLSLTGFDICMPTFIDVQMILDMHTMHA